MKKLRLGFFLSALSIIWAEGPSNSYKEFAPFANKLDTITYNGGLEYYMFDNNLQILHSKENGVDFFSFNLKTDTGYIFVNEEQVDQSNLPSQEFSLVTITNPYSVATNSPGDVWVHRYEVEFHNEPWHIFSLIAAQDSVQYTDPLSVNPLRANTLPQKGSNQYKINGQSAPSNRSWMIRVKR